MAPGPDPSALADLQAASFERANEATRSSWPPDRRMRGEQLDLVLRRRRYAVVASTRANGRPHATPVAFVWHDGEVWLPAVEGAVRVRNVGATPWLSVVITEGDADDHGVVVLEGPARVLPLADAPASLADSIAAKGGEFPDWASVWLVVSPSRLLSYAAPGWKAP
jgi:hypothetical protein